MKNVSRQLVLENFDNLQRKMSNEELLKELISKQLPNISIDNKLQYSDLRRICKYINNSIFDENICCIWNGYITNLNNNNKGTYINFYFKRKKVALHRILYINFVGDLSKNEYIKFTCVNKGKCCNVKHLKKFTYEKRVNKKISEKNKVNINCYNDDKSIDDPNIFILTF